MATNSVAVSARQSSNMGRRDVAVRVRAKFGNNVTKQEAALLKSFPSIDSDGCYEMLDAAEMREYAKGEYIIKQGEENDEFYMVRSGKATVHLDRGSSVLQVGRLKPYDTFGEAALIDNGELTRAELTNPS